MKRVVSAGLALFLASVSILGQRPLDAVYAASAVIEINDKSDWLSFAASASAESATRGRTVELTADLDFSGEEIKPVPVFCGTFQGNGHKISGVSVSQSGAAVGLFRYIEEDGKVLDLNLEITIDPEEKSQYVGGIAGRNRGIISSCIVSGFVTAEEAAGGIAGWNEPTGVVENCDSRVTMIGNRQIGGIVGDNNGIIRECSNYSSVNRQPGGVPSDSETELKMPDGDQIKELLEDEKVKDSGGIAGRSDGSIRDCENYGQVGCSGSGYNVGGIVGRQNGIVTGCVNRGTVEGRKDVGGIAGQLEPHLLISYESDTLDGISSQLDQFSEIGDSISSQMDATGDEVEGQMDESRQILKEIKNLARDEKEIFTQDQDVFDEQLQRKLDQIDEILANMELDLGSRSAERAASRIRKTLEECRKLLESLRPGHSEYARVATDSNQELILDEELLDDYILDEDSGILGDLTHIYEVLSQLYANGKQINEDIKILVEDGVEGVVDGVRDLTDDLDSLRQNSNELLDLMRERKDQAEDQLDRVDDDVTEKLDRLYSQMDALSDTVKDSRQDLQGDRDRLDNQLDELRSVMEDGRDRVQGRIDDRIDEEPVFTDVSDAVDISQQKGLLDGNRNDGAVKADYQAGGIVGMIGMELSADPEADIETYGSRSLNLTRYLWAVVENCKNSGKVVAVKDYAGGVAGKASVGAISASENYGDVTVQDGSYAGGVAGESKNLIRDSYSMCTVSGKDYVGGIAGLASKVKGNTAMACLQSETNARTGAIAGWMEDDGAAEENKFVDQGVGAVDGISRDGEAVGYSYEQMLASFQLPEEFSAMKVTFLVNGSVYETMTCEYGSGIKPEEFPRAPEKDGFYYQWEDKDLSFIDRNITVEAIYQPWTTVLSSDQEKQPLLLAEGRFYPGTILTAQWTEKLDKAVREGLPEEWKGAGALTYEAKQDPMPEGMVTLHFRYDVEEEEVSVGILDDTGKVETVEVSRDGRYLVFEAPVSGTVLVQKKGLKTWTAVGAGLLFLAAAAALLLIFLQKKGKGQKNSLSNHGSYGRIKKLIKNTSADSDGGAAETVPEETRDAGGRKNQMEEET